MKVNTIQGCILINIYTYVLMYVFMFTSIS